MLEILCWAFISASPSIGFQQAVDQALAHHPALRLGDQEVLKAEALVDQARAPSLPVLSASGSYVRLDADRMLQDRVVASANQLGARLDVQVPLVNPARWGQWYRSGLSLEVAVSSAADLKRQVALNAARAWLSVLAQKRVLEASELARQTAEAHLAFARDRRAGGVGNALDAVRAAQEFAVSRAQVEVASGQLARLREALGVALGADEPVDANPQAGGEPFGESNVALEQAMQGVSESRSDVRAAKVRVESARSARQTAWMDYLPVLVGLFQPSYQEPPSATQPRTGWQAQLVLSVPLYEGGLHHGQDLERRAALRSAELQLEVALRQARSEVRTAFQSVRHADEALAASRDAAAQASEALELATLSWKAGATGNLEVVDAERRARDAQTQVAVAEDAARQSRLDLLSAAGQFPW